jgi:hypothetical protein
MVNIKLESGWFLIENKVLFWSSIPNMEYINLALEIWEDIVHETSPYSIVEYPGEYDIDWVVIRVFWSKDWKLNYIVNINDKKIGVIQSPKILEEDEVSGMYARLYLDDAVEKKIDQLELEWKKFKLWWEDGILKIEVKDSNEHQEISVKVSNTNWEDPEIELE